jgi:hypothetical protein
MELGTTAERKAAAVVVLTVPAQLQHLDAGDPVLQLMVTEGYCCFVLLLLLPLLLCCHGVTWTAAGCCC